MTTENNKNVEQIFTQFGKLIEGTLSQLIEKSSPSHNDFITYKQTCEFFKISRLTLRRWIKQGKLKPINISPKRNYFRKSDILSFIESSQSKTTE